jgi:hypothetical protein
MRTVQTNWLRILMAGSLLGAAAACLSQESAPQKAGSADQAGSPAQNASRPKKDQARPDRKAQASSDKKDPAAGPAGNPKQGKADAQDKAKGDAKEKPAEEPEKETKETLPSLLVEPGYSDWGVHGSQHKFRQYATPPRGFFLPDIRFSPIFTPGAEDLFLNVKSFGQADYTAEGRLGFWYGNTLFRGLTRRNRFFEPTPALVDPGERRVDRGFIRQAITKSFSLSYVYRLDDQRQFFEPPFNPLRQQTQYQDIVAGGKLFNGYATLGFNNFSYRDRTGQLPDTTTRGVRLGYLWELTSSIGLEGAYSRSWIEQAQQNTGRLDTLSLDGDFALGPATTLDLMLRQRHIDLPQVQNAFVRDQRYGALQIGHRFHGWKLSAGARIQEAERVRGDHTSVDVPRWRTFDAKVTGRLTHEIRMTLRGSTQTMDHPPLMITSDPRSLYWSGRDTLQLKLDGGFPNLNTYLEYAYRHWRNEHRSVSLTNNAITAGGDWQVSPRADVFVEYAHEFWSGTGQIPDFPTFENFLPDSRVVTLGLNWGASDRLFFSVNYSDFASFNDNPLQLREGNAHGNFVTLNARYRFPKGYELGLLVSPWTFRDRVVPTQDYDATVFMVTGTAKF